MLPKVRCLNVIEGRDVDNRPPWAHLSFKLCRHGNQQCPHEPSPFLETMNLHSSPKDMAMDVDFYWCFHIRENKSSEWWKADVNAVLEEMQRTGGAPNISDAFTINGQPGDLYPCSKSSN
ncbi:hypothetical protein ACLOJK_013126 [Asimina triloba]